MFSIALLSAVGRTYDSGGLHIVLHDSFSKTSTCFVEIMYHSNSTAWTGLSKAALIILVATFSCNTGSTALTVSNTCG
jgi:hypothetical protein